MKLRYLGIFLNSKLRNDEDINRQVCYLYETANRLKTCFYNRSKKYKMYYFAHIACLYMHVNYGITFCPPV